MSAICPKCGLPNTGSQAMGLAMSQCICHFQPAPHPSYGEMMSREKALDAEYKAGWNSGLEMAACRIENDFKKAFGKDTLTSFSAYLRGLKK
jgi:hypothetical protein